MIADLQVLRAIKGRVEKSVLTVSYFVPEVPMAYSGVAVDDVGVFFLRHDNNQYRFTSVYYPFLLASKRCAGNAEAPLRSLVSEFQCALNDADATSIRHLAVVDALNSIRTEDATVLLKLASASPEPAIRWRAIASLLLRNDITELNVAVTVLTGSSGSGLENTSHNLAFAIAAGVRNPEAIPSLRRMLHSTDVIVRRASAEAMRSMRSATAIDGLIELLNDSDPQVRYFGVIGLAEITGDDEWAPSTDYFIQNEAAFLLHWREWAKARE